MRLHRLREDICRIGESLFARGYVHATAGNISVRLSSEEGGGYLITPTDACLGRLDPAQLSHLDDSLKLLSGERPSKTIVLHQRIYASATRFDPATRCVIHTHSTHCVALSLLGTSRSGVESTAQSDPPSDQDWIPPITPYFVMKVGHVPLIAYHRPGDPVVADRVEQAILHWGARGTPIRAVMLDRLGPNVWHDSPQAAMATLEELEETARLCLMTQPRLPAQRPADRPEGNQAPKGGQALQALDAAQIDELRRAFGARW
jgi:3-dehydro-4-phosphotetronate decarboxylase